jgi:ribosome biogenesis protein BRX1
MLVAPPSYSSMHPLCRVRSSCGSFHFQVIWSDDPKTPDEHELSEIGPRLVLNPIRIFTGAFGGPTLYENENYVSPNEARRKAKEAAGQKFRDRRQQQVMTSERKANVVYEKDEVEDVFRDADLE